MKKRECFLLVLAVPLIMLVNGCDSGGSSGDRNGTILDRTAAISR